jgi:predicted RNase H-like nuclease
MRSVLGIDAAWTVGQPSGVALAKDTGDGWELVTVAASYQQFHARADNTLIPEIRPMGSVPVAGDLLSSCRLLCGGAVGLIAVDMPLSHRPIMQRRASDDAVSRAYGRYQCGTHNPSAERPGRLSDEMKAAFERMGYPLLTTEIAAPGLIEVYPHPALVELMGASRRLPYKAAKARKYWPGIGSAERRTKLFDQWREIVFALDKKLRGVVDALPAINFLARGVEAKAYENSLDAVICAWVAICALEGRARAFGDIDSAIWIPESSGC